MPRGSMRCRRRGRLAPPAASSFPATIAPARYIEPMFGGHEPSDFGGIRRDPNSSRSQKANPSPARQHQPPSVAPARQSVRSRKAIAAAPPATMAQIACPVIWRWCPNLSLRQPGPPKRWRYDPLLLKSARFPVALSGMSPSPPCARHNLFYFLSFART
jgi:hypothetical protein